MAVVSFDLIFAFIMFVARRLILEKLRDLRKKKIKKKKVCKMYGR